MTDADDGAVADAGAGAGAGEAVYVGAEAVNVVVGG